MALRLSIDKKINEELIPKIDEKKFLGLDITNSDRIELFLFAMSLGIRNNKRTPLQSKHGFILESSIYSYRGAMSYIFSVLIEELRKTNEEDKIDDEEYAFKVAEEYANTGFYVIKGWLEKNCDEETIRLDLISEMNDKLEL